MNILHTIFLSVLYGSIISGLIAAIILCISKLFSKQMNPKIKEVLLVIVVIKFLIPVIPLTKIDLSSFITKEQLNTYKTEYKNSTLPKLFVSINENKDEIKNNDMTQVNLVKDNTSSDIVSIKGFIYSKFLKSILSITWFLVFLCFISIKIIGIIKFKRRKCHFTKIQDNQILEILDKAKIKLGIKKSVSIYMDSSFNTPCIAGIINPTVYLPEQMVKDTILNSRNLYYVFLHELSHYKKFDLVTNYLSLIVLAINWFNPFAWMTIRKLSQIKEVCCDAKVLENLDGEQNQEYGMTIIQIAKNMIKKDSSYNLAYFSEYKNNTERRLGMIKLFEKGKYKISIVAIICLICVSVISIATAVKFNETDLKNKVEINDSQDELSQIVMDTRTKENTIIIDSDDKSFDVLDRLEKYAEFDFKVPDYIINGFNISGYHLIKSNDQQQVLKIFFLKNSNHELNSYTIMVSPFPMYEHIRDEVEVLYNNPNVYDNVNIDVSSKNYNIKDINILEKRTDIKSERYDKEVEINIKKHGTENYVMWEADNLFYLIHHHQDISKQRINNIDNTVENIDYSVNKEFDHLEIKNIINSMVYSKKCNKKYRQTIDKKGYYSLYDWDDVYKVKALLGFDIKLPLSLTDGIDIFYAYTFVNIEPGYLPDTANQDLALHLLYGGSERELEIEFRQAKKSKAYDDIIKNGSISMRKRSIGFEKLNGKIIPEKLIIRDIDVYRALVPAYDSQGINLIYLNHYYWMQDNLYYKLIFSGNGKSKFDEKEIINNIMNHEIVK